MRRVLRSRCVNAAVTASAIGRQVRERRREVVAAKRGPQVHSHRLRDPGDIAAFALTGEVVAMEGGESEPLPCRGCAAGRPALFVAAPVVGARAIRAQSDLLAECAALRAEVVDRHGFTLRGGPGGTRVRAGAGWGRASSCPRLSRPRRASARRAGRSRMPLTSRRRRLFGARRRSAVSAGRI